jgi:hypothetical protein
MPRWKERLPRDHRVRSHTQPPRDAQVLRTVASSLSTCHHALLGGASAHHGRHAGAINIPQLDHERAAPTSHLRVRDAPLSDLARSDYTDAIRYKTIRSCWRGQIRLRPAVEAAGDGAGAAMRDRAASVARSKCRGDLALILGRVLSTPFGLSAPIPWQCRGAGRSGRRANTQPQWPVDRATTIILRAARHSSVPARLSPRPSPIADDVHAGERPRRVGSSARSSRRRPRWMLRWQLHWGTRITEWPENPAASGGLSAGVPPHGCQGF